MENNQEYPKNEQQSGQVASNGQEEAAFENPSVDPGFATEEGQSAQEGKSPEEQGDEAEGKDKSNDALNYKNDRENGAYNPKNI